MKFSAADWCYYNKAKNQETYYTDLKANGYDGVEMVDQPRWQIARDAGLEMINLSGPGMEKGLNRIEHHEELIPEISDCIVLAGENKIPHVIVFSGNRDGQDDDTGIANCCIAFEKLLPIAEENNVTLMFEMLNSTEHADYQADKGEYGFKLAAKLNHPNFKLLYDIYHMERMGCDAAAEVVANLDMIGHIHVAESPGRTMVQADGVIKYKDIIPKIIAAGYTGYWGMEFPAVADSLAELKTALMTFQEIVGH